MKIILFAILAVLGLLIFLLCIVLLTPVRYGIWGKKEETVEARVQVHWLLHLVSVLLVVEQGKVTVGKVRLCGFTLIDLLSGKQMPQAAQEEDSLQNRTETEADGEPEMVLAEQSETPSAVQPEVPADGGMGKRTEKKPSKEEKSKGMVRPGRKRKNRTGKKKRAKASRKSLSACLADAFERFCNAIDAGLDRLDEGIDAFWEKVSPVLDTISAYYTVASEESAIRLVKKVLATVVDFIKYILPVRLQGHLCFGMAEPAAMGQICSIMAVLLPWYGESLTFTPDFEKQVMEGEISCRGRIRLGHFVWKILLLVCSRDFWHVIKGWRGISARKGGKAARSVPSQP